jgi:hypothetical protein
MKPLFLPCLLALAAIAPLAHAGEENFDIDTKFRAKLEKEKIKQAARDRDNDRREKDLQNGGAGADCGSQSIGNVNTNGRPGTAPREVFVFAPNAINFVGAGGCR